jgi:hypothetical protein
MFPEYHKIVGFCRKRHSEVLLEAKNDANGSRRSQLLKTCCNQTAQVFRFYDPARKVIVIGTVDTKAL